MSEGRLPETSGDQWDAMAKVYQRITVGTSHRPIGVMLERANALLPFSQATGILDTGCGPGPVMQRILEEHPLPESCSLTCADFSEGMIKIVREQKEEQIKKKSDSPWNRLEVMIQDAMDLNKIQDASQSHVTAGWVFFMTKDPQKCLSESRRALEDGGVLTCSSWKGSEWLDLTNLLKVVRPDKVMPELPAGWREADAMKAELEKAGFRDVACEEVTTKLSFDSMDELVDFMLTKMPHSKTPLYAS